MSAFIVQEGCGESGPPSLAVATPTLCPCLPLAIASVGSRHSDWNGSREGECFLDAKLILCPREVVFVTSWGWR